MPAGEQQRVQGEKHRPAVHAPGEQHADRFARFDLIEPVPTFIPQGADVGPADRVEIGGQLVSLRGEEPCVARIRVRTAHQRDLHDVVGGNHPRVRRMELLGEPLTLQVPAQLVDPLRHDKIRSIGALREKVAHRSADRPRQAHDVSVLLHDRELPIDVAHPRGVAGGDLRGRLGGRHIEEHVGVGIEEIDEPLNRHRSGHHTLLDRGRRSVRLYRER